MLVLCVEVLEKLGKGLPYPFVFSVGEIEKPHE